MSEVVVVVHLLIERGKADEAIAGLSASIEASHHEPGCLLAALHRDINDPDVLVIVERWASEEDHKAHLETPHIQRLAETVAPLMAGVPRITLSESVKVGEASVGRL